MFNKSEAIDTQIKLLNFSINNITNEQLFEIHLMLSQYFGKKASDEMKFLDKNGIDTEIMMTWSQEQNRRKAG